MTRGRLVLRLPDGTMFPAETLIPVRWPRFTCTAAGSFDGALFTATSDLARPFRDGDWTTPDLTSVIGWFCANVDQAPCMSGSQRRDPGLGILTLVNRVRHRLNRNTLRGARSNIRSHYDLEMSSTPCGWIPR